MKKAILIIALTISFSAISQDKTIYFTKDWKVTTKDNAIFYRPTPKKVNDLWLIKDYYIDGAIQFKGFTKNVKKELWDGDVTWYLPNGKIEDKARYKNGKLLGSFVGYEGVSGNPKDGYDEKDLYFYDEKVKPADVTSTAIETIKHYYINTNQIAELHEMVVGYDNKTTNTTFFDKNGNVIAKLIYDDHTEKYSGTDIIFYEEDCEYASECQYIAIKEKITYNEGKKTAIKYYTTQEKLIADGLYKDEKPFQGSFFKEECDFYKIIDFKQGVIQKETVYTKENYTKIATTTYKNGTIYKGTFYDCNFVKNYKKGKLNGKVIEYTNGDINNVKSEFHYKNGLKNGAYKLFSHYGSLLEKGTYKNDNLVGVIWHYNANYDNIEHNPDVSYTNYFALKLKIKGKRIKTISMYNSENELDTEFKLAQNSTDTFGYLKNGIYDFLIYDYNFDGHLDFSIKSNYHYEKGVTASSYYLFNPNTKLYEHCHYLDNVEFDTETKTVIKIKNDNYDGDFSHDDGYEEYKVITTYNMTKKGELIKIKEIDQVTTYDDDEKIITTQIYPLQINKFPLLNPDLPPITFSQNGKKYILNKSHQEIKLKKAPFSITFPLMDNTKIKGGYYNARITVTPEKELLKKVKVGTRTKKTKFYALGTAMATTKTDLSPDDEGHNALAYENSEYDKVQLIERMTNNVLLVRFNVESIKGIPLNSQNKFLKQPIYLLIFIDKNLNERVEEGELHKVKLSFKK